MKKKATLILSDGTEFHGYAFGAERPVAGEVVFNHGDDRLSGEPDRPVRMPGS